MKGQRGRPRFSLNPQTAMKALYLDDSVTSCECCGRTGLKVTVAMKLSCGGIVHYGRTCAARNSGKTSQQVTKEIRAERRIADGRAFNYLSDLKRSGTKITRELIRNVADQFRSDVAILSQWNWA
jgi:hypothetical protein